MNFLPVLTSVMVALTIVLGAAPGNAQTTSKIEEPQYIGQFSSVGADGKLTLLEKENLTTQSKTKNHFISVSSSSERVVPNAASPIRVGPTAHFIVNVGPMIPGTDPNQSISMKAFVIEKDQRALPVTSAKAGMFQGVKSQQVTDAPIPVTFKPYGQASLEIIPSQPLPPGEYALSVNGGVLGVFCFGVDAK